MGVGLPPIERREEVHDARVAVEHDHAAVAAAVDPAAAGVGPVAGAAAGGFAGRLVAASHIDLPGGAAHVLGGSAVGVVLRPLGIVLFVAVFLIDLWNDAAGFLLLVALVEHPTMLRARPFLERREAEPFGRPILVPIVRGMIAGEVAIGIGFVEI